MSENFKKGNLGTSCGFEKNNSLSFNENLMTGENPDFVDNYSNDPVAEQILLTRIKLEQIREKKKILENENDNLNCKINDLRLIIDRISKENE